MKKTIAFIFVIISLTSYASHVAGGYISYEPTSIPNEYLISAVFYRDCSGINAPSNIVIEIRNDCGILNPTASNTQLQRVSSIDRSNLCLTELQNSSCSGGAYPSIEEHIYQCLIILNGKCDNWIFSYQVNARSSTDNNDNGAFFIKTTLNNKNYPNNHSPIVIDKNPSKYIVTNTAVKFPTGIYDPDLDSLKYSFNGGLIGYKTNSNLHDSLDFKSSFSAKNPMQGIDINSKTGLISLHTLYQGTWTIPIMVEEFDPKGNPIDTVLFEFTFIVDNGVNYIPLSDNDVSNFKNFGTNAIIDTNEIITMCKGDLISFQITFNDSNLGDSILLSSDVITNFPNAKFNQIGINPAIAEVSLSSTNNLKFPWFTIYATDNKCPIAGKNAKTFIVQSPIIEFSKDTLYHCSAGNITYNKILSDSITWYSIDNKALIVGKEISCNPCLNPIFYFNNSVELIAKSSKGLCNESDTIYVLKPSSNPLIYEGNGNLYTNLYKSYQWSYNGIEIPGEISQSIIPKQNGEYSVSVSNGVDCVNNSLIYTIDNVRSTYFEKTTDVFNINRIENQLIIKSTVENSQLYVYDLAGKKIFETNITFGSNKIQVPYSKGLYIIKIINAEYSISVIR